MARVLRDVLWAVPVERLDLDNQRTLNLLDAAQLQRLDAATVLEHVKEHLDFPARSIPIDQFDDVGQRGRFPIGQQTPLNRRDALGSADFAGHNTGHCN